MTPKRQSEMKIMTDTVITAPTTITPIMPPLGLCEGCGLGLLVLTEDDVDEAYDTVTKLLGFRLGAVTNNNQPVSMKPKKANGRNPWHHSKQPREIIAKTFGLTVEAFVTCINSLKARDGSASTYIRLRGFGYCFLLSPVVMRLEDCLRKCLRKCWR